MGQTTARSRHLRLVHGRSSLDAGPQVAADGADAGDDSLPAGAPVAREVIDDVVTTLANLTRSSHLDLALKVGEIVVARIYRGDLEALRHRGSKDASFRKLADHPRLPFSAVTLWRSVAIFELVGRMPGLAKAKHLGVAHLRAVVGLSQSVQERLLKAAETERWSKEKLEERAAKHRKRGERPGRRPMPPGLRRLRHLDRLAGGGKDGEGLELDLGKLDDERVHEVEERLERIRAWCAAVERALVARAASAIVGTETSEDAFEAAGQ